jgi:hypothetical protein
VDLTLTFTLTPKERRQSLRVWSFLGTVRASGVGLPIAAAGVGLVIWNIKPGAASGWGVILAILGLGILAFPQMALIHGLIRSDHKAHAVSDRDRIRVTFTDALLKFERDESATELPWRRVTDIRTNVNCWIISIRDAQVGLVVPKRAIPDGLEAEVTEFLRQRSSVLSSSVVSD